MGTIKGKNNQDLMEEEQIKKRWQEYTELYKKGLNDPDNHEGVVTRLEPDILEYKVNWALGSITMQKPSEGEEMPAECFRSWKMMLWKCCTLRQPVGRTQQSPQDWKRSVFTPIPEKGDTKKCSNYCTTVLTSHASKAMLKMLQARLQQYMNQELTDV